MPNSLSASSNTSSKLQIRTAKVFEPLLKPARYKGAYGGRGSGKSWFFGQRLIALCIARPGTRAVCIREVQKSLTESVKLLLEDTIRKFKVEHLFDMQDKRILTPGDGMILFQGMKDHTAESIKSLEGFDIAYVEEAQTLTSKSLEMLRPTMFRKPGVEIWFSWNPRSRRDPVDELLRGPGKPDDAIVVASSYQTNPWFPPDLEKERLDDQAKRPDRYGHIWEGDYEPAAIGAYYAEQMAKVDRDGRIKPLLAQKDKPVETWWDLGFADPTAVWFVQRTATEIWVLDYWEQSGKSLSDCARMLQEKRERNDWIYGDHVWPHDGADNEQSTGKQMNHTMRDLGFPVVVLARDDIGPGIDAVRNMLARCWFDPKCERGLEALRNYRAEYDDNKLTFKPTPLHDWASHGADAFRYGAMHAPTQGRFAGKLKYDNRGIR